MLHRRWAAALAIAFGFACAPAEPPGIHADRSPDRPALPLPPTTQEIGDEEEPTPLDDLLTPMAEHRLLATGMHSWVYQEPQRSSKKIGYLRAGATVARAAQPTSTDGCPDGFYRVAPRGFICVGQSASLDLNHPVARATLRGPRLGDAHPYHYVMSRLPPPHRYVRLPSPREQRRVEGTDGMARGAYWERQTSSALGEPDPLPPFYAAQVDTPKPFGAEERLRFESHRGRARPKSAFGLSAVFLWHGRRFGLTTELDLIPIDRTNVIVPSSFSGRELNGEPGVVAFVMHHGIRAMKEDAQGHRRPGAWVARRSSWLVEPEFVGADTSLVRTLDGGWLPRDSLRFAELGRDLWGYAKSGRKWIDVSIDRQTLVAYEGERPVYATLVSTGRGETGDPETTGATVQGTFFVEHKHVTDTMDGDAASDNAFDLHDVPYVQYFHHGYALHGVYWHDDFGKPKSNGCVNLAPADAAWLFAWTTPNVPEGWHGAVNRRRGTLVYIHP